MKKRIIASLISTAMLMPGVVFAEEIGSKDWTEKLDRGLRAVQTDEGVYLSWRLHEDEDKVLGTANGNVSFDIYRDGVLIATESETTNYIDADGKIDSKYIVVPEGEAFEVAKVAQNDEIKVYAAAYGDEGRLESVAVFASEEDAENAGFEADKVFVWKGMEPVEVTDMPDSTTAETAVTAESYLTIPLQKPADVTLADGNTYSYSANDASCGDLDGDGEYEIILKWDCNGQDNSNSGYTGNVLLDAYKLDGTFMWRIDLGQNIRAGAHYTQFMVYDLDGDGKAEIGAKTAPGSKDSTGTYVTKGSHLAPLKRVSDATNETSYVDEGGRVLTGAEYYTVFDGEGKTIDTISYPFARGDLNDWGDNYGNRGDRFLGAIAYLDGVNPSIIAVRGYYAKTTVASIRLKGGILSVEHTFTTDDEENSIYTGQGNHNITVADVDDDGKDEVISGSICWDDDLSLLWCSGRGHGDALHIGDYDPTHDGLEYFSVHESGGYEISNSTTSSQGKEGNYGMTVYDAATGEELYHRSASSDTGRGMMANIGSGGFYQIAGSANVTATGNGEFEDKNIGLGTNFRIFWDGDLYDELLNGTSVSNWNGSKIANTFTADGCTSVNGSKSNPSLQADLLGDWREEIVYPTSDSSALRVYMTTEYTGYKMKSLMYDKVYREGVAAEQTAYNQPPHVSFYLADDVFYGKLADIEIDNTNAKTTYYVGEEFDKSGLVVTGKYIDNDDRVISDYSVTGYDSSKSGIQTVTISYLGISKTYDVTVIGESGISVVCADNTFEIGSEISKSDFEIRILYEDGTEAETTDYRISEYNNLAAGSQIITITYAGEEKTFTEEVEVIFESDLVIEDGVITGYNGSAEEVVLPLMDGETVITGVSDGVFADTTVKKVYIYSEDIVFDGDNIFPDNVTIACIEGSTAHEYATNAGLTVELISIGDEVTFEEEFYSQYIGKDMLMQSNSADGTLADEFITYKTLAHRFFSGYGFGIRNENGNNYLHINSGIYDQWTRTNQVYIQINETVEISEKQTVAFDMMFPSNSGTPYIEMLNDTETVIDTISVAALGLSTDEWYRYELVYDGSSYTANLYDSAGVLISSRNLGVSAGTKVLSKIAFKQDLDFGSFGSTQKGIVYIDNMLIN